MKTAARLSIHWGYMSVAIRVSKNRELTQVQEEFLKNDLVYLIQTTVCGLSNSAIKCNVWLNILISF